MAADLQKELMQIINELIEKKFLPAGIKKEDLVKKIIDELSKDKTILSLLQNGLTDNLRKVLAITCIAEVRNQNTPALKFDYKILFKNLSELKEHQLKNELKKLFIALLKFNPKYLELSAKEKEALEKKIEEMAELFATKSFKRYDDDIHENVKLNDLIAGVLKMLDPLKEFYRELYGVTQTPGEIEIPVYVVDAGNQMAVQDLATFGESFLGNSNAPSGGVDPMGIKMIAIINFLADGQESDLEKSLRDTGVLPSINNTPRLTPPNGNG